MSTNTECNYQLVHRRGGLNPPVYIKQTVIGQIQSAPTAKR